MRMLGNSGRSWSQKVKGHRIMHVVGRHFFVNAKSLCLVSASVCREVRRGVGMFSSKINPVTGKAEWVHHVEKDMTSEACDLSHELARSQYGDMLHDTIRNQLYCKAIEKAVSDTKSKGKIPHVLDIGTGTGLLSMMAARAGASRVTAVEVLQPMVRIAREVIADNGYSDVITVIPKRSTDMTEEDMIGGRANILVTEVFDTELIGEGALLTYSHALLNLMESDSIVIPDSVTVYVQLLDSKFLWHHHKLVPERIPYDISVPTKWSECRGAASLWDLHAEQLQIPQQMVTLSSPTVITEFSLSSAAAGSDHSVPGVLVPVSESGICHGVMMWWSADMNGTQLTMSPWQYIQWRDHWLQAIQLLPQPLPVTKGDKLVVVCNHDDYSMWFDVTHHDSYPPPSTLPSLSLERPVCTCGMHTAWSRTRIAMHNNTNRTELYINAMTQALSGSSISSVLCISDGSLIPLLIAKADIPSLRTIYILESNTHSANVLQEMLDVNHLPLNKSIHIITKPSSLLTASDLINETTPTTNEVTDKCALIGAVIGEPYFSTSLLPWHNLHFWYSVNNVIHNRDLCTSDCRVIPGTASLMAIAVSFKDLYSLRAPVGTVEGFDISTFDKRVGKVTSNDDDDEWVEPEMHPLWEYPAYPRSDVIKLMTFDLGSSIPSTPIEAVGTIELTHPHNGDVCSVRGNESVSGESRDGGRCNGVVMWMEYQLTDEQHISTTGLVQPPGCMTDKLSWDTDSKQAVHFLPPQYVINHNTSFINKLQYIIEFNTANGELTYKFTAT